MMRSLWTAASGMVAQQQNIDTISNNLANVNTYGFKKERMEFKSLLYETMKRADMDAANRGGAPVNLQVGHGVRTIATSRSFTQGNLEATQHPLDFVIEGQGFFVIQRSPDEVAYTKDGAFKLSITDDGLMLVTSDGYPVLSTDGDLIVFPTDVETKDINVTSTGVFTVVNDIGETEDLGFAMDIVQFSNVQGLEAVGANLYMTTPSSGEPMSEAAGDTVRLSNIVQGYLEMSNVQVAEEMVKLIVSQRAYELNSKAIQTSDDMLQTANNLKR